MGFAFILLYYFQIKLALLSYIRTTEARLRGMEVTYSGVLSGWGLHLELGEGGGGQSPSPRLLEGSL